MLKASKFTALVCAILIMHGQQSQAVWQNIYAAASIVTNSHVLSIETAQVRGSTIPPA